MSRTRKVIVAAGVVALGALWAQRACAQCADTLVMGVLARMDSLLEETVRRSATTGRYLAPRATVVRHHARETMTLVSACNVPRADSVAVSFGSTTTTLWEAGVPGVYPRGDSAVICAVVQVADTAHRIGSPYVVSHTMKHDSITWRVVVPSSTGALREACRPNWNNAKYGHIASRMPFPVRWVPRKVEPFVIAFPFAEPVVP